MATPWKSSHTQTPDARVHITTRCCHSGDFQRTADLTLGELWKKIDSFVDNRGLQDQVTVQLTEGARLTGSAHIRSLHAPQCMTSNQLLLHSTIV